MRTQIWKRDLESVSQTASFPCFWVLTDFSQLRRRFLSLLHANLSMVQMLTILLWCFFFFFFNSLCSSHTGLLLPHTFQAQYFLRVFAVTISSSRNLTFPRFAESWCLFIDQVIVPNAFSFLCNFGLLPFLLCHIPLTCHNFFVLFISI